MIPKVENYVYWMYGAHFLHKSRGHLHGGGGLDDNNNYHGNSRKTTRQKIRRLKNEAIRSDFPSFFYKP